MASLPKFVPPQLSLLVEEPPEEAGWLYEVKFDGYRMALKVRAGKAQLLTRTGLDWTAKYPTTAAGAAKLMVKEAYIDGELCSVRSDGTTSFARMQAAIDQTAGNLVYFAFDLLHLDGHDLRGLPLRERKVVLKKLLKSPPRVIKYSGHFEGSSAEFQASVCKSASEGIMCKRADAPYISGNRGLWLKVKCHQRAEFVILGYSDPEGSRAHFGSLLLGYYSKDGKLMYAGRVGTGFSQKRLAEVFKTLQPHQVDKTPLDVPPPRKSRFGSPAALSRIHWLKPKLVAEVRFISWTADGLLRHTAFVGMRSDKKAREVRQELPAER